MLHFYQTHATCVDYAYVIRDENESIKHIVPNEDHEQKDGIGFFVDDNMEKIEIKEFHISQPRELIVSSNLVNEPVQHDFWALIEHYLLHYTIYKSCRYYTCNNTIKNTYLLESAYKIPDETLKEFFVLFSSEEIEKDDISYLLEHSEEPIYL